LGRTKKDDKTTKEVKPIRRAIDPEAREKQLIALSYNLVEQRLLDGTASAQETVHFLKLGSIEKQLELEKTRNENALLKKKVEALDSQIKTESVYADAIAAMKIYSGHADEQEV